MPGGFGPMKANATKRPSLRGKPRIPTTEYFPRPHGHSRNSFGCSRRLPLQPFQDRTRPRLDTSYQHEPGKNFHSSIAGAGISAIFATEALRPGAIFVRGFAESM